jgi:hypothetical protein
MALNINGRMKVKTLRADFKTEFGLTLRVYDGKSFADDDATLASIRKGDSKGGEFSPRKNTKVGNLEDKFIELFGIKIQVSGSDDSYLCNNDLTLAGAYEEDGKKLGRKEKKTLSSNVNSTAEETEGEIESDDTMTIEDALSVIGRQIEMALEEDEDAISWDTEIEIKDDIVRRCELEDIFTDESELENMYTYEMFKKVKDKVSFEKQVKMIQTWISSLEDLADIQIELDISSIKMK